MPFRKLFTWCTLSGSGPDHCAGRNILWWKLLHRADGNVCTGRQLFLIKEGVSMRIKEVIEKTGLSRRTIQFYISQKLIMPKEDPVNGYHDFSNEDVRNLIIISRLRRLDFPVFRYPPHPSFPRNRFLLFLPANRHSDETD